MTRTPKSIPVLALAAIWTLAASPASSAPLGGEFQINTFTPGPQIQARTDAAANGDFVSVWRSEGQDGDQYGVYGRRYFADGTPKGPEFQVNTTTAGTQILPRIDVNASGEFAVTWIGPTLGNDPFDVYLRVYDAAGVPAGPEVLVNTTVVGDQNQPSVGLWDSGEVVVAWGSLSGQDGDAAGCFARVFDAFLTPLTGEIQLNTTTLGAQRTPAVVALASGDWAAIWQSDNVDGESAAIVGRSFAFPAAPMTGEYQVNDYWEGIQGNPAVTPRQGGGYVAAWGSGSPAPSPGPDGSEASVAARLIADDGSFLSEEILVNTFSAGLQNFPDVAANAFDGFVVVWESMAQDGDARGVFAQIFDAAAQPLGCEFQVNTSTEGGQLNAAVGASDTGPFVVTWYGRGDGDDVGIWGQMYDGVVSFSELDCFASNCSKLTFGMGFGDGKVTMSGAVAVGDCPAELDEDTLVELLVDGTSVFAQPLGAFDNRRGAQFKYRQGAVSMQLDLDRGSWKLTDRMSDITASDVDNSDGVTHQMRIGGIGSSDTLFMDQTHAGLAACRKGGAAITCD